jgi:hypothetical protein
MNRMLLLAITSILISTGHFLLVSNSHITTTPQSTPYTKVIIRLPGKVSIPDDDPFKIITDPIQLSRISKFIHEQLDSKEGWLSKWDGVSMAPHHFLQLGFYQEDTHKLNFGVGGNFFSPVDSDDGYRIKRVPKKNLEGISWFDWDYRRGI